MTNVLVPLPHLGQRLNMLDASTPLFLLSEGGEQHAATIVRRLGAGEVTVVYELTLVARDPQHDRVRCVMKLPSYERNDPQRFSDNSRAVEQERRVTNRLSQVERNEPHQERYHIPHVLPYSEVSLKLGEQQISVPALVTSFAPGRNVEVWHMEQGGQLPEPLVTAIGAQLARVMQLAHQNLYQCADMKLDRLFWDGEDLDGNLTVIDWNVTPEIGGDDRQQYSAQMMDITRLVELMREMLGIVDLRDDRISSALRSVLSLPTHRSSVLGNQPTNTILQRLTGLVQLWRYDLARLYGDLDQATARMSKRGARLPSLDDLYEQIDLGQRRDTQRQFNWDMLRSALNNLWARELERIRHEIAGGNATPEMLTAIREIQHYPQEKYPALLLRRRLLELAHNGQISDIRRYVASLDAWDDGNYRELEPLPDSTIRRELGVLASIALARHGDAAGVAKNDTLVNQLQQAVNDSNLDSVLQTEAKEVLAAIKQARDQAVLLQASEDFVVHLRAITRKLTEERAPIPEGELVWLQSLTRTADQQRLRLAVLSLDRCLARSRDGSMTIAGAITAYQQLASVLRPEERALVEQAIAAAALQQANLPAQHNPTIATAFDALAEAPAATPARFLEHVMLLDELTPLLSDDHRRYLQQLQEVARQVMQDEQIVHSDSYDFTTKEVAFTRLRKHGIIDLGDRLSISSFDPAAAQRAQAKQMSQLRTFLKETLDRLPETTSSGKSLGDLRSRVMEIDEALRKGGPDATALHTQLWATIQAFAEPFILLTNQHHMVELRLVSSTLVDMIKQGPATTFSPKQLEELQPPAEHVARLRAASAGSDPDPVAGKAISQVRSWLDDGINAQLQAQSSGQDADLSASIKHVLHLLQVRRALDGTHYHVRVPMDEIAPLLPDASTELRKALIERLDPNLDSAALARALTTRPAERWPRGLKVGGAVAALIVAAALGWGLQYVPGLGRGATGVAVIPSAVATQVVEPTVAVALQPLLSVSLDKPQLTLRPGESTDLTLVVRDANTIAESALLEWSEPAGITITGTQSLQLQDGRARTVLTLAADETIAEGAENISVTLAGQDVDPLEIALTVSGEPQIVTQAKTLSARIDALLTLPVGVDLTLREQPVDTAALVRANSASVRIIEWTSEAEFVKVQATEGQNPAVGWVKPDEIGFDPNTIKIDVIPLRITSPKPIKLAPNAGATEGPAASGNFELMEIVPLKGANNQFWIHLRQLAEDGSVIEGWAPIDQTDYRARVSALVEQLGQS